MMLIHRKLIQENEKKKNFNSSLEKTKFKKSIIISVVFYQICPLFYLLGSSGDTTYSQRI